MTVDTITRMTILTIVIVVIVSRLPGSARIEEVT
jgi:hypothetical protein